MNISITEEKIKEIAQELDTGMLCYYHITAGEVESVPDELKGHTGYEAVFWKDSLKKIKANRSKYICFEGMESGEVFRMMERFAESVTDNFISRRLHQTLQNRKPFHHFKVTLKQYPSLLQQWHDYKDEQYILHVKQQLQAYNLLDGD